MNELPYTLEGFRDYHAGETFLVCGCGSSLSEVVAPERFISVGVNDVGRLFQPDYLVVLNLRHQFKGDRFRYVEESRARAVFTQTELGIDHPHVVPVKLGTKAGVDFDDPSALHYTANSPYLALCLAVHMGAKRVGLIGVDFTDHHFFAPTGRHSLTNELQEIEREYARLAESCRRMGVEVVNLSAQSRLKAFPKMSPELFARVAPLSAPEYARAAGRKVFFVNYKFKTCGEVFERGLSRAAEDLGVPHESADWDDPALPERVRDFSPELLFVVHGRNFAWRWPSQFGEYRSAVWLLDEPYEVDDTARYSGRFGTVFTNDPGTLHRHHNAHYLPVCYDPAAHTYRPGVGRRYAVGFVGGYSPLREELLELLARRGLLSYVVGGPWRTPTLARLCLSRVIPPAQTALLYRDTQVVLNVFRSQHHFNCEHIPAASLNPRVYEATQCGALVVSEQRPELATLCPELPTFRTADELVSILEETLKDAARYESLRRACIRRLAEHTYARRLASALDVALGPLEPRPPRPLSDYIEIQEEPPAEQPPPLPSPPPEWEIYGDVVTVESDGTILLKKAPDPDPGTEQGLAGRLSYGDVTLSCEVFIEPGSVFIAKIHQESPTDQLANSYHVMCFGRRAYFARHDHVFRKFEVPTGNWFSLRVSYQGGSMAVEVNGAVRCKVYEKMLPEGFCFLGLKGGTVRLRGIRVAAGPSRDERASLVPPHRILYDGTGQTAPAVSIITTVYDRAECLERCLRSTAALEFQDYEQIVVADSPPPETLERLREIVERHDRGRGRLLLASLERRHNNWGISPAAVGLHLARGRYVCFLSDDNGYTPDHLGPLVAALEDDPWLGFAYSSCLYDGRRVLESDTPDFAFIDLGQPVFRRELFDVHFGGALPFKEAAWDWHMIEHLVLAGVRWRHLNRHTFIFRLAKYPHLIPPDVCEGG